MNFFVKRMRSRSYGFRIKVRASQEIIRKLKNGTEGLRNRVTPYHKLLLAKCSTTEKVLNKIILKQQSGI
jgi:hypothetical protein